MKNKIVLMFSLGMIVSQSVYGMEYVWGAFKLATYPVRKTVDFISSPITFSDNNFSQGFSPKIPNQFEEQYDTNNIVTNKISELMNNMPYSDHSEWLNNSPYQHDTDNIHALQKHVREIQWRIALYKAGENINLPLLLQQIDTIKKMYPKEASKLLPEKKKSKRIALEMLKEIYSDKTMHLFIKDKVIDMVGKEIPTIETALNQCENSIPSIKRIKDIRTKNLLYITIKYGNAIESLLQEEETKALQKKDSLDKSIAEKKINFLKEYQSIVSLNTSMLPSLDTLIKKIKQLQNEQKN